MTNSQRLPGSAMASRAAVARPETPPAQPSPKTGTRRTSGRRPSAGRLRASMLGVAMPVVETETMPSMSLGREPGIGDRAARRRRTLRRWPQDRARLRSAQPCCFAVPVDRRDDVALVIPALSNTPDSRSNKAPRPPNIAGRGSWLRPGSPQRVASAVATDRRRQMARPTDPAARREACADDAACASRRAAVRCHRWPAAGGDQGRTTVGAALHGPRSPNSRRRGRWRSCPGAACR